MATKSQRYGKGFEYEIRDLLRESTGLTEFERTPHSGAWVGGSNKYKAATSRADAVEILAGDLICPESWRWVVECKNEEDVPVHQLFMGESSKKIDEFLDQVTADALLVGKEPLLFMKWRKKGWKLPKKIKDILVKANVPVPSGNSITVGIIVAERKEHCEDIANINHICYTSNNNASWRFFDYNNWMQNVKERQNIS